MEEIIKHESRCKDTRAVERHKMYNKMQDLYTELDNKIDRKEKQNTEIDTKLALQSQTIKNMNNNIKEIKTLIKDGFSSIDEKFKEQEKKFANKWTEKVLIFIGGIVGSSIIGSLMYLVIK